MTALAASVAAASLTLAAIHAGIWLRDREATAHLGVSLLGFGVAWFAWASLAMMGASTPVPFVSALRWANGAIFLMVAGIIVYVRFHFRTARPWLGHLAWMVRLLTLVVNTTRPGGMDYVSVSAMRPTHVFGQAVFVPEGVTSAWHWVGQGSLALLLWFVADASWRLWRSGTPLERRRALLIGVPTAGFVTLGAGQAALIFSGVARWPHLEFLASLGMLCAISYELGSDVLRAARLSRDLQASHAALRERDHRMAIATEAARELSGRLINAQEDERRRIARDLHDDLNQRLALLSVDLELLGRSPAQAGSGGRAAHLASRVRELSTDVHRLAYQLHPAKLDQLGLVTATRSWCRDVAQQSGVRIEFGAERVPADLPDDVALCLFRIAQEALQNVVRHSGAGTAHVTLTGTDDAIQLVVIDEGRGFQPDAAGSAGGLGLVSMQERVRLLRGAITVSSSPGRGTRVSVRVPFAADRGSEVTRPARSAAR